jgi:DNA-binding protein H-NS
MTTLQELIKQRDELNARIEAMQKELRAQILSEIRATMREYDLRIEDMASGSKSVQRDRGQVAAKYRNPVTQQTWSGRGKRPQWVHEALAEGKSLDEFSI